MIIIMTTSSTLHRYNKQAQVELSCNVKGLATGTFQNTYLAKIKSEMPPGVSLSVGGSSGSMQKSMASLIQNAMLSILLLANLWVNIFPWKTSDNCPGYSIYTNYTTTGGALKTFLFFIQHKNYYN